jgi:O-antigen/teichoic acid export membrane protein
MSRFAKLTKSSSAILASQITTSSLSILFLAYYARVFSKPEMALFAFISLLGIWLPTLAGLGLNTLAIKNVAEMVKTQDASSVQKYISSIILYRFSSIFIGTLLCLALSKKFTQYSFGNMEYLPLFRLTIIIGFFVGCKDTLAGLLQALQKFYLRSFLNFLIPMSQMIFGLIGYLLDGIRGFLFGFLISTLLGLLLSLYGIRSYLSFQLIPFKNLFRSSFGYWGLDGLRGTLNQLDQPVVAMFLGAEALAGYYIGKRIYEKANMLVSSVVLPAGVIFGEVRAEGREALQQYFHNTMLMAASLFIPLGFFTTAISRSALLLYAGDQYLPYVPIAMLFGITLIFTGFWMMMREAALRLMTVKKLMVVYVCASGATLISYGTLLPILGILGVPISIVIGFSLGNCLLLHSLKTDHGVGLSYKTIISASICGFSFLATGYAASLLNNILLEFVLITIICSILYLLWNWMWGPDINKTLLLKIYNKIYSVFRKSQRRSV